jgi:DNA-binding beta-propeller fold protein YncE
MTIGVSELQKNISIIRNLKETLYVIDKKTNELLATILPNKKEQKKSLTEELAGSMANGIIIDDLDKAISQAYDDEMMKKYGHLTYDK